MFPQGRSQITKTFNLTETENKMLRMGRRGSRFSKLQKKKYCITQFCTLAQTLTTYVVAVMKASITFSHDLVVRSCRIVVSVQLSGKTQKVAAWKVEI